MTVEIRLLVDVESDRPFGDIRKIIGDIVQGAMDVATDKRVHIKKFSSAVIESIDHDPE